MLNLFISHLLIPHSCIIFALDMGRIVAIDYGQKRTGIAATDMLQLIANGLTTVASADCLMFLKEYTQKEKIDAFVVGLPKQANNTPSEAMKYITPFANKLRQEFPGIEVVFFDERFTSILAHQAMIDGGLKKKTRQNKALVDKISATIILQGYLEKMKNEKCHCALDAQSPMKLCDCGSNPQ